MNANELPRIGSGISGIGGKFITRASEVTSSGTDLVNSCQVWSTSEARSIGKKSAPAKTSGIGSSSNSSAVTTPKSPPAAAQRPEELRIAVGVDPSLGRRSASTSSIAVTRLHCEAVLAAVPADPAAEAVAGDPDRRRGAVAGGQARAPRPAARGRPRALRRRPGRRGARRRSRPCSRPRCGPARCRRGRRAVRRAWPVRWAADPQPLGLGVARSRRRRRRRSRRHDRRRLLAQQQVEGAAVAVVTLAAGLQYVDPHDSPFLGRPAEQSPERRC